MKTPKTTSEAKWLPGALALAAVGAATHANAATVQITFTGSYISTTAGNHLVTDFGGDGVADLRGHNHSSYVAVFRAVTSGMSGVLGFAAAGRTSGVFALIGTERLNQYTLAELTGFTSIRFSERDVRGGSPTTGYLEIAATGSLSGEYGRVEVRRLVFDDATGGTIAGLNVNDAAFTEFSAVPEPSSLGLLALGACGLLTRRRRAMAA